ncbi:MAG: hypothetical protein QM692_12170 [Thermomicrobiales bacterium]
MHHSPSSTTRRSFVTRGLGLIAALAGARLATEAPPVAADKKKPKKLSKAQIALQAQAFADYCADDGGTAETDSRPGGVSVTCTNPNGTSTTCTFHSKGMRCTSTTVVNPGALPDLTTPSPWVDPGNTPVGPLEPTEPTIRAARTRRRRG